MLRIMRITLLALLPTLALAAAVTGCDDDTSPPPADLSGVVHDMAHQQPPADMAHTD